MKKVMKITVSDEARKLENRLFINIYITVESIKTIYGHSNDRYEHLLTGH